MGWRLRFWRRVKVAPGVTLNLSKGGLSTSVGPRGAKTTVGRKGIRQTLGIPGSGLSMTRQTPWQGKPARRPNLQSAEHSPQTALADRTGGRNLVPGSLPAAAELGPCGFCGGDRRPDGTCSMCGLTVQP